MKLVEMGSRKSSKLDAPKVAQVAEWGLGRVLPERAWAENSSRDVLQITGLTAVLDSRTRKQQQLQQFVSSDAVFCILSRVEAGSKQQKHTGVMK